MLSKKFRKYITPVQRRKFLQLFTQKFNNQEYLIFLKKFRGSMISRGKRSFSYKLFDGIRIYFKKILKEQNLDFNLILRKSISNLIPILGVSNVRRGRKVQTVPALLKFRKRVVLINKWLIKNQKNRSNVRGIKVKDVSRLIALALFSKGGAYDQKIDILKRAYAAKHILLRMGGRRVNKRAFKRLQKKVLDALEKKHGVLNSDIIDPDVTAFAKIIAAEKSPNKFKIMPIVTAPDVNKTDKMKKVKPEILADSIGTLFSLIIFFKYKRKYKRIKMIEKDLRDLLLYFWRRSEYPLEIRWKVLWYWILNATESTRKKIKINTRKLDILKPKYKLVCEDIVKRTG